MKKGLLKPLCLVMAILVAVGILPTGTVFADSMEKTLFPLWVEGVQITSENKGNVLGDGKVRFDSENGVLFLSDGATVKSAVVSVYSDAEFVEYETCIASELEYLTVRISGNVTLKLPEKAKGDSAGLISGGDTLICGKGTLNISGGDACKNASFGLVSVGTLTVEDGIEVNATGGNNASVSLGILAYLGAELQEGVSVNAKGGNAEKLSAGIYCYLRRPLTVDGASLTCEGGNAEESVGICADLISVKSGELVAKGKSHGLQPVSNLTAKLSAHSGNLEAYGEKGAMLRTEITAANGMTALISTAEQSEFITWDGQLPLDSDSVTAVQIDFEAFESPLGDVNGDGGADSLDAALILQADAGLASLDGEQLISADINADGTADALDAAYILKLDAGLIK